MDRLKEVGIFLVITLAVLLGLRAAHLLVGAVYPASLPGPFLLDSLDDVERYAGFSPHIPFYRPIGLGAGPAEIIVERRPRASSLVRWRGDAFLEILERDGGARPVTPDEAVPLPGLPSTAYWMEDDQLVAVLPAGDHWIRLRTDLSVGELRRIVDTLLPYDRLI